MSSRRLFLFSRYNEPAKNTALLRGLASPLWLQKAGGACGHES